MFKIYIGNKISMFYLYLFLTNNLRIVKLIILESVDEGEVVVVMYLINLINLEQLRSGFQDGGSLLGSPIF